MIYVYTYTRAHTHFLRNEFIKKAASYDIFFKTPRANSDDLYASDVTGIPIFATTMSLMRTKFLLNLMAFDDANTRPSRALHKAAPITEVMDMFTQNCLLPYSMAGNVKIYNCRYRCFPF